jgi:hypothetical protein
VPALVAALVLLGVSIALAGHGAPGGRPGPSASPRESPRPQASATRTAGPGRTGGPVAAPSARPAPSGACERAMADGDTALERGKGEPRAIRRISENCAKNPQAAGLLRALRRQAREHPHPGPVPQGRGRGPAPGHDPGRHVGAVNRPPARASHPIGGAPREGSRAAGG